ncbi:MAG: phosphonate ABC transporter, permease protein PhnE [Burkholderiaceae bacterium]
MNAASLPSRPPRSNIRWMMLAIAVLIVASFATLDLQFDEFLDPSAYTKMREFIGGFFPPMTDSDFLRRLGWASLQTIGMSLIGTVIAAVLALALAIPAAAGTGQSPLRRLVRSLTRLLLNALRSVPELVWASLLVIAAGLGPFPGTLALAAHTTGVLGRLFADTLENLPTAPVDALRHNGTSAAAIFAYATVPLALPQLLSYSLYRWENNIRAAAVLGVVGAGGLGQMLHFHLSLFHMQEAAGVVMAMLILVGLVDALSYFTRRHLTR